MDRLRLKLMFSGVVMLTSACTPLKSPHDLGPQPSITTPAADGGDSNDAGDQVPAAAGDGAAGQSGGGAAGASGSSAGGGGASGAESKPACGDGKVGDDERCDIAIKAGRPGACPDACKSDDVCMQTQLVGSMCQSHCEAMPREAANGDACCPEGANRNLDDDCPAVCGNGVIEPGETCDPLASCTNADTCQASNACLRALLSGDPQKCTSRCTMMPVTRCMAGDLCCPSGCTAATDSDCSAQCGDGVVDGNEKCERTSADKPCPTDCDDHDVCTTDTLLGSAEQCSAECVHMPVTSPKSGDACCPENADATNDSDCKPKCGNGVVESGELCDGACPTSCPASGMPCLVNKLMGSDCSRHCVTVAAVESKTPDACCPSGSTSIGDPDCAPVCGNQVLEAGEVCDDGNTRSGDGCSASCKPDDDTTTPGDDRAGYVTCNNGSSCAPDSRCCSAPTTGCVPPGGSCQLYTPQCDGPEDCPDGKPCMASMVGRSCGSSGFAYVCHTDKDCVNATCSGSGTPCRRCDAMSSSCSSGS